MKYISRVLNIVILLGWAVLHCAPRLRPQAVLPAVVGDLSRGGRVGQSTTFSTVHLPFFCALLVTRDSSKLFYSTVMPVAALVEEDPVIF